MRYSRLQLPSIALGYTKAYAYSRSHFSHLKSYRPLQKFDCASHSDPHGLLSYFPIQRVVVYMVVVGEVRFTFDDFDANSLGGD